jgi:ammonium transporter, Amt family
MDVFAEHGVAGMIGLLFNAFFAADYIIGLDGVNTGIINGGWLNHNYKQLYIQVAYIVAATGYAFVMSAILALIINFIPGLHLRASEEAELLGMDDDQLGEFAYDYVAVRRDYLAWTPAKDEPSKTESNINPEDRHGIPQHSEMINGHSPDGENEHINGNSHTGIMGDRHGIAAEDEIKEKQGLPGANGNHA